MRKYLLHIIISLVFLLIPVIRSSAESHITLRSSCTDLSFRQVPSIPKKDFIQQNKRGYFGFSTINNIYGLESIDGDKVVVDNATGLMWHQFGTRKYMKYKNVKKWLKNLNSKEYAGYNDWRLPTVEEALALLESNKSNGLYIDSVFSNKQRWIWTGDRNGSECGWGVNFILGYLSWDNYNRNVKYVRPVRSVK
jgi:hypothetical protein